MMEREDIDAMITQLDHYADQLAPHADLEGAPFVSASLTFLELTIGCLKQHRDGTPVPKPNPGLAGVKQFLDEALNADR